jgi:3-isopropylmalate/(R)-2-methylmalate dehydratase large subunit
LQAHSRKAGPAQLPENSRSLTLVDKIWNAHSVCTRRDGRELIYIDRHMIHELHAPHALDRLTRSGRPVSRPDLTFAVQDHTASTRPGRVTSNYDNLPFQDAMRIGAKSHGITIFDLDDLDQGIVHVIGPELGLVLPGATHAVPDSHASTVGAIGALSFASGTTELEHILATQTLAISRPRRMRVQLSGRLGPNVSAKDVAMAVIGAIGVAGATGAAVEYAGPLVSAMSMEDRLTLCNLSTEMGARTSIIAPDDTTLDWLHGRPYAPIGTAWELAELHFRSLRSDDEAVFDSDVNLDFNALEPQITWGTDPSQVTSITGYVPEVTSLDASKRAAFEKSLHYMGLVPGQRLLGLPVDRVFIGSCTNGRLQDLAAAAEVLRGRRVADSVSAMVVPGSQAIKREAERLGLADIFQNAGFFWGESGCSMCAASNGDRGLPGERCLSTTNRNFENRQGKGVRTHLVSPASAAAAAIEGKIADVRAIRNGASS